MGLVPVQLSAMNFAVREPHQRHPLEFPPTTSAEADLEDLPLADGEVSCYRLDVPNIAEEVEIHLHDSSLTPSKRARKRAKRYYPSHSVRMARRRLLLGRYAFFGVAFSPCPILSISLK